MAKSPRINQRQFGQNGPTGDFGQFGSKANSTQTFTKDPTVMQSLTQFLNGWGNAIIGNYQPCLEDMNSLFFLAYYQICYLFQEGIPEWETGTSYYIGSRVKYNGVEYMSLSDTNIGQTPGGVSSTYWQAIGDVRASDVVSASTISVPANGNIFKVTGNTNITTILNPNSVPRIQLFFTGVLTVNTGGNISLANGAFTTQINSVLALIWNGTQWMEQSRAPIPTPTPFVQVGLGAREAKSANVTYQAATDGFVTAFSNNYFQGTDSLPGYYMEILSDAAASPTTRIAWTGTPSSTTAVIGYVSQPIKKGDYYRVNNTIPSGQSSVTVYWMPLGS